MNNTEHNFIQTLKKTRLSDEVRTRMRTELAAYAELHALPQVEAAPFNSMAFMGGMLAHSRKLVAGVVICALVIATGSASALAAETAVPGEVLYPIKVQVTEPARVLFAGSAKAKARVHAALAVRRVQEAEILRARGALTMETESELTSRFSVETDKVVGEADKLEAAGDTSESVAIRADLATLLSEQTVSAEVARVSVDTLSKAEASAPVPISIRETVATRAALLRVREPENRKMTEQKKESKKSKDLLIGVSVKRAVQREKTASSTASTTPRATGAVLEKLFRSAEPREIERVPEPVPSIVPVPPINSLLR